jgi:protein involved in temperature-dependent protein secretion
MKKKPLCPEFKTPCKEYGCVAWQNAPVEAVDEFTGARTTKMHGGCTLYFWIPLYLKGIANRADGTQRAVEEHRNQAREANVATIAALGRLRNAAEIAALRQLPAFEVTALPQKEPPT